MYKDDRLAWKTKVEFMNKIPQHPCDRLDRKTKNNNEDKFVKQVPQNLRDRLAQKTKNNSEVQFIMKVLKHPLDRLARKNKLYGRNTKTKTLKHRRQRLNEKVREIATANSQKRKKENFKFDFKNMLNKGQLFDLTKTNEDQIFYQIIEGIPKDNDEFHI